MAVILSSCFDPQPKPHQNPKPNSYSPTYLSCLNPGKPSRTFRRDFLFQSLSLCIASFALKPPIALSANVSSSPSRSIFSGIANTKSWFQFYGDGFSIRVPPQFEDLTEPELDDPFYNGLVSIGFESLPVDEEDFNAGRSLYGDKAKPKAFAARFASSDGSEVVSVLIKPSNELKITFLEPQDITDLGSLKEAARIFVPGGATLYAARTIKIKEDEGYRTYYFYEFGRYDQHVALVAAVNSGKVFVAGAAAPQSKWDNDGIKLRSAAMSLTVL